MDSFTINSIDPQTGNVNVTFTISGVNYQQIISGLTFDNTLNIVLGQKLISLQNNIAFISNVPLAQPQSATLNPDNSITIATIESIINPKIANPAKINV